MAAPIRVREKTAWKTVEIPQDLLNSDNFDGLIDIYELNDYDLVSDVHEHSGEEGQTSSKSEKRKRKKARKLDKQTEKYEREEPPNKKPKQADTNKISGKGSARVNVTTATDDNPSSKLCATTKKKKKKRLRRKKENSVIGGSVVSSKSSDGNGVEVADMEESTEAVFSSADGTSSNQKNKNSEASSGVQVSSDKKGKKRKRKRKQKVVGLSDEQGSLKDDPKLLPKSQASKKKKKKERNKNKKTNGAQPKETDQKTEEERNLTEPKKENLDMSEWKNLYVPDEILEALQDRRFTHPTTIQKQVLPCAIRDRKDILGAAETGSGKTLAFGIPILSKIMHWRSHAESTDRDDVETGDDNSDSQDEPESDEDSETESGSGSTEKKMTRKTNVKSSYPLALILEPTRELAIQVKNHLVAVAAHTNIMISTIVGGMSVEKQRRILGRKPQVIIATPGRLWQLIEEGNDHLSQVDRVLCLVVDEADRMVEKGHFEELTKILEMMNGSPRREKKRQTFVMSATLTMDISAPDRVLNKMKKKNVKNEDKLKILTERICIGFKPKVIDLTPKDKVAQTLTELRVNCKAVEKDFYLYYFLRQHPGRTLVFANSKDCLRRLISIFTLLECSPMPLHADMHQKQRLKNLDRFSEKSNTLLVASDVAARGLDIPNVDHVVHYQVPRTMENYVHRSGRTARASNQGLSVMFVSPEDVRLYRKIVTGVRNGEELPVMPIEMDIFPTVKQRVSLARDVDQREYRLKKKRVKNNFFKKAAEEMDMIIDDEQLLEDMGDPMEQAEEKHQLSKLKAKLAACLKGPLMPQRMTKYPTKSGQLTTKKMINLYGAL